MSVHHRFTARIAAGTLAALLSFATTTGISAESSDSLTQPVSANSAEALSVYNVGKRSYDAGDYTAALRAFAKAARLDPGNARWHYNLGLTLRQLDRFQAAREAFLAARQRDPEYKREEINKKLISMGFDSSGAPARSRATKDGK